MLFEGRFGGWVPQGAPLSRAFIVYHCHAMGHTYSFNGGRSLCRVAAAVAVVQCSAIGADPVAISMGGHFHGMPKSVGQVPSQTHPEGVVSAEFWPRVVARYPVFLLPLFRPKAQDATS